MNPNRKAFLDMIAYSEGTINIGDDGYNCLFGGSTFEGYEDHPRKAVKFGKNNSSTAAGRYQVLARYYDYYRQKLCLNDFSPEAQDSIAIQYIKECRALEDIDSGKIKKAIYKCKKIWASFPGAGYGQHENKIDDLISFYKEKGGTLAI